MASNLFIDDVPVAIGCIDGDMDAAVRSLTTPASRQLVYDAANVGERPSRAWMISTDTAAKRLAAAEGGGWPMRDFSECEEHLQDAERCCLRLLHRGLTQALSELHRSTYDSVLAFVSWHRHETLATTWSSWAWAAGFDAARTIRRDHAAEEVRRAAGL